MFTPKAKIIPKQLPTLHSRVLLEKLIVFEKYKNSPEFIQPEIQ
jgi:hypothetical protein